MSKKTGHVDEKEAVNIVEDFLNKYSRARSEQMRMKWLRYAQNEQGYALLAGNVLLADKLSLMIKKASSKQSL